MKYNLLPIIGSLCITLAVNSLAQAQSITAAPDGTGTIVTPVGSRMDIQGGTQAGANLFHSFGQFNVEQNQIANFLVNANIQNILSRVVGGNPSHINGVLQVMGSRANLYLMNPAGIVFGSGAQLNVSGSFTATTANAIGFGCSAVRCEGFFPASGNVAFADLTGNPNSVAFLSNQPGAIFNAGTLSVLPGQSLTLLGGTVINTGTLNAPGGTIAVVAVPGERLVRIQESGQVLSLELPLETRNLLAANAQPFNPLSLPQLLTGGRLPDATGVMVDNGVIKLTQSHTTVSAEVGSTTLSGQISVASTGHEKGGLIQVLGDRVALQSAQLDASGASGGTILVGGDYQGRGIVPNAKVTVIDRHSTITADGLSLPGSSSANGGKIIVWADNSTQVSGKISAQGGALGGNGGFVETSSKVSLSLAPEASVNTAAPNGLLGTWLLDPTDLTIVAAGGTGTINGGTNSNADSTLNANVLIAALNGTNVTLQASNSITVNALIDATANSNGGDLTLQAPRVTLNQPILLKSGSNLSGTATTVNVGTGGSVQNAVDVANSDATITFAPTTYTLTQQVKLNKDLTLNGVEGTMMLGSSTDRVFRVDSGQTIVLNNLRIANGAAESGGGIYNAGFLTLNNSTVASNQAANQGGGIYNTGSLTLNNSTITSNQAPEKGGLYNLGFLTLNNSNIANNSDLNHSPSGVHAKPQSIQQTRIGLIGTREVFIANTNSEQPASATVPLVNLVQGTQVTPIQNQPIEDRPTSKSSLAIPVLNVKSQSNGELAVTAVDGEFTNAYQQYLGLGESKPVQLEQVQATLAQLKQERGLNSALIYASFVPHAGKPPIDKSVSPHADDQLQLILIDGVGNSIVRRVPVTRHEVVNQAKLFRLSVADPDDPHSFIPLAHQLYGWLLAPLEADLQAAQITNLVFCLDEGLRTIPIAALMQQNRFLIEQYSVSVIPSAALTNLDASRPGTSSLLAMGADHFAGKEPLPAVPLELKAISSQIAHPTTVLNEGFTLDNLLRSQQQSHPEILHLATHAEFNPGVPHHSYIQLWNTKLTLDQVRGLNWKGMNLTLLTLSACITAISSPEAEMGFAGLASVSGVRSTLGSLWMVSDVGTLVLMNEFYGRLKTSNTIAGALQAAQLSLLKGTAKLDAATVRSLQQKQLLPVAFSPNHPSQFSHPFYWSAFTLVGNPW